MTDERKNKLNSIRETGTKIKEQIEKLEQEYSKIQAEAIKEIVTSWIEDKDLKDYCLTFSSERFNGEYDKPIFMELECFVAKTQDLVREKREELEDLIYDYSPTTGYHFSVPINDFVTFYGSDYSFGFKFANFNPEKIKAFANEYGLIIKCSTNQTVELYDIRINELTEEKNRLIKYQKIFE